MNGNFVLIFDKRVEISNKYRKVLEHNYTAKVVITSTKEDFFNQLVSNEPDLILISESVSEQLSELCQKIRDENLQFRPVVILLSKSSFLEDKTNALNSGADDFWSEPIDPDEFIARVNAHLRRTMEENANQLTKFPEIGYTKKVIRRTIKHSSDWAMMLIGIDNFSFYREIYGEIAGNKLLQAYSAILSATIEYDDFVGQITPETFLVITSSYKAEKFAEYLNFAFDSISSKFYSKEDADRGYLLLQGTSKAGCKIPLMTASIGIVKSELINYLNELEVINALNKVQKLAKTISGSAVIIDRPLISSENIIRFIDEKNVIVLEQDEDLGYLLETTLKIQGFSPVRYNLSDCSVDDVLDKSPLLIIIDRGEDEGSALEFCKKIKSSSAQNIKIIFTDTAHEKEQILSSGADLYLPKPYDLMELFQWIYKLLD